jgi:hypothetical protein
MLIGRGINTQPLSSRLAFRINALHGPSWQITHGGLSIASASAKRSGRILWRHTCGVKRKASISGGMFAALWKSLPSPTPPDFAAGCDITLICGPAHLSNLAAYKEAIVHKVFVLALLGSLFLIPAAAQQPPANTANPLSTWLRGAYIGNRNNIMKSAEKMPEEN